MDGTMTQSMTQLLGGWTSDDSWAVATLLAASLSAALIGVNLFLRRLSLLGDALSHAVLPGIIAAVILAGSTAPLFVVSGALAAALLSVFTVQALRAAGLGSEGALGVTFTSFFAIGILGLNVFGSHIDLDPGCVLYGSLELTPLETMQITPGLDVPRAAVSSILILLGVIAVTVTRRRRLMIAAFEPDRLRFSGSTISLYLDDILFLAISAGAVVNCFFAMGAIATTGILVSPAVIARMFSTSMSGMWSITMASTVCISVCGYIAAYVFDTPVAGAISGLGLLGVILAALLSPHGGLIPTLVRSAALRTKIAEDDVLADRFRASENRAFVPSDIREPLRSWLRIRGLLTLGGDLTPPGLLRGRSLVRSHRAWELYLANELKLPADHVHGPSDRMEHFLTDELTENLVSSSSGERDPHGKLIPPRSR